MGLTSRHASIPPGQGTSVPLSGGAEGGWASLRRGQGEQRNAVPLFVSDGIDLADTRDRRSAIADPAPSGVRHGPAQ
ncbi:MAG: hypothetical protein K6T78_10090 [Alicyclobacillus sp.]|nr:hypothetical protein [Alicyclobacillus sp.]